MEATARLITATATEMQNSFGRYLKHIMNGGEVIVTRNGKEIGRLIPKEKTEAFLTDSLTGILKGGMEPDAAREERLRKKYDIMD